MPKKKIACGVVDGSTISVEASAHDQVSIRCSYENPENAYEPFSHYVFFLKREDVDEFIQMINDEFVKSI